MSLRSPGRGVVSLLAAAGLLAATLASPVEAAPPSEAAGPPVPVLTVERFKKSLRKHRGKAVLLHLWATWCLPCLDELPMVSQFADDMRPQGLEVVSVSLDEPSEDGADKVRYVLSSKAPRLSSVIVNVPDPDAFVSFIDREWDGAIPANFAIDQKGEVRGRHVGEATRKQLEELVGYLLKRAPAKKKPNEG